MAAPLTAPVWGQTDFKNLLITCSTARPISTPSSPIYPAQRLTPTR